MTKVESPDATRMPRNQSEFGQALRRLRTVGIRSLAARQQTLCNDDLVLSKSQLERYEQGLLLPRLNYATHLDALYQSNGWIELALAHLWLPNWNPWDDELAFPALHDTTSWPANYHGIVWIKLLPIMANTGRPHKVTLDWGPWTFSQEYTLNHTGLVIVTGKAADESGTSVPCNIFTTPRTFVLSGLDEPTRTGSIVDIRQLWRRR